MNNIKPLLTELKNFLEPKWNEKHVHFSSLKGDRYDPKTPDYKMCRYTALFLQYTLKSATGLNWNIEGGDVWPPKFMTGGIKAKDGEWQGHYWVRHKDIIVDLTATQFGYDEIIITNKDNENYQSNYSKKELSEHMKHVRESVKSWLNDAKSENLLKQSQDFNY